MKNLICALIFFGSFSAFSEVTVKVFKGDGSPYWTDHFNDVASANKWLDEEKTRKYWDSSFTTSITDTTATDAAVVIANKTASDNAQSQRKAAAAAVKSLITTPSLTKAQQDAAIQFLLKDHIQAQGL